jgi:hypothetical protein
MDIFSRIRYGNHADPFVKREHDLHQIRLSKQTSKIKLVELTVILTDLSSLMLLYVYIYFCCLSKQH